MIIAEKYGDLPKNLGEVNLNIQEMMFWLYCPVKLRGQSQYTVPDNLNQFQEILDVVQKDIPEIFEESYIYLTAKSLYVTPENPGNRPGFHSDGFGTNDLNYIWYNCNPTIFWEGSLHLPANHVESMEIMDETCWDTSWKTYPEKNLLKLDQRNIHKVNTDYRGFRCFVKVSVSDSPYNLKGNSINHRLLLNTEYRPRKEVRNCPQGN